MCGINGVLSFGGGLSDAEGVQAVEAMTGTMIRRGPDDSGLWAEESARAVLGFRRLAILDLTPGGHQPMVSADGRSVLVFNGEIYNHLELRRELEAEGVRFRSRSDTEVLLEALNRWGVKALGRLNGMFGLGYYDRAARTLLLARDHAGIKPVSYYLDPRRGLVFASQYNSLLKSPWLRGARPRPDVLALYLRLHHIPPPYGLLEGTHQLEPGHYLLAGPDGRIEKRAWWSLPRDVEPELRGEPALAELDAVLDRAIEHQRIADVPLGVFLSGGVDSPLVAAYARRQTGPGLKAFTIGSPGWAQDETEVARLMAGRIDLDQQCLAVSGDDAIQALPDVVGAQYEPFGDFSIIPTLLVSRLARAQVTVALSGDGGDELFFGYERPQSLLRNAADFRWPRPVRMALYGAGRYGLGPRRSAAITARSPGDYYLEVNCRLKQPTLQGLAPSLGPLPPDFTLYDSGRCEGRRALAGYSRWVEYHGQLQRTLKKVDMASMHHSLEVRVPLLDRTVVETSLRIDPEESMRGGGRKTTLIELLGRRVSTEGLPREKRGFAVPLAEWLRGPLKPRVEQTLFEGELYPEGLFDRVALRRHWDEHCSGRRDHKWSLWTMLSLQWWARANGLVN